MISNSTVIKSDDTDEFFGRRWRALIRFWRSSNRRSFTFPPSNWESLHSQSRQFPPPTRASPLSSSFVSELSLVRLVLNALQGVESSLISTHKLSYPAERTTHQSLSLWHRLSSTDALGQIL
ncbi:hypothetical protein HID58_018232 [Brassica napus]|uniref:Uncharacterized protein n=1 Tax=Brassica napus TaxID=3708 RepID=A0ABQ8D9E4_BRANA|nr:hypothetical protein HID58_018232 [Brassica napus]